MQDTRYQILDTDTLVLIMRLTRKFYNRPTITVARELLGKILCRKIGNKIIRARITETEAYCGSSDRASHASKGLTPRTKVMFGMSGFSYVYLIYGMYHCLNVVTERKGYPAAVLIRSAEITNLKSSVQQAQGHEFVRGPGILCRELAIDRNLNSLDLIRSRKLWIVDSGEKIKLSQIKKGKRIGVDYAGEWKDKLWRFWI